MEEEKRVVNFFRFESLRLYEKALEFTKWVHHTTDSFPEEEKMELGRRIRIASQDIALNIAEGSGRGKAQFAYQLKYAKTSIRKVVVLSAVALRLELITSDEEEECKYYLIEISKMLGALITSLYKNSKNDNYHASSPPHINETESQIHLPEPGISFDYEFESDFTDTNNEL